MKKTYIKKRIDDLVKAAETKFGKKCEIMTLNMKTQLDPKDGSLFCHAEACSAMPKPSSTWKATNKATWS